MHRRFGMGLKLWRFVAVMSTALLASTAFAHLWQLAPRLRTDGAFWLETLRVYRQLGHAGPGALEVLACGAVLALALAVRSRGPARRPTALAALLLLASFAAWWLLVRPVNLELSGWRAGALPSDWPRWRARWEFAHAVRAALISGALAALVVSLLRETPRSVLRALRGAQPAAARPAWRTPAARPAALVVRRPGLSLVPPPGPDAETRRESGP